MASVLGLDIGGSTTRGQLVLDGIVAGQATAGSASLTAAGEELAERHLRSVVSSLRAAGELRVDAVCAGAAGSASPSARAWLTSKLAEITGARRVSVVADVELVLPAARHRQGIAVICGTGSIAYGRGPRGEGRAGGWGWLLGDEAGGYVLTRGALQTLLARRDAGRPGGRIEAALLENTAHDSLDALLVAFYADPRPEVWAACAPAVLGCGDPAVQGLLETGADALATSVARLAARLGVARDPVVLAGGLVADASVQRTLRTALAARLPRCPVEILRAEPVSGAVALALEALGSPG